ncbi:hypothetical protein WG922_07750 [Ramlibacter sp. AN1015]|uniref:hypothetical protein n=1 Tax=Ramlibacter sp. AN1015 TaxID=3133428 RepID=UPI0030BCCF5F
MGKLKDSLPTTDGNLLPTAPATQVGFLAQLSQLAQPVTKAETVKADPVQVMRARFATNADENVKAIKSAADSGSWFRKLPNGKFLLAFRNANQVLSLGGNTHFQVDNAPAAVKLIEAAKVAAAAGELDDQLKATQRKRKGKQTETTPA